MGSLLSTEAVKSPEQPKADAFTIPKTRQQKITAIVPGRVERTDAR
jgi:hypothetical protein